MAERLVIDLLVETGGALRTIQDFRDFVKDAKTQLQDLEVGSETFNRLSAAIGSANTRLKELEKIQAGLTREEIAGAYARIGGGISSSFAAAQAAVSAFGVENDAVLQAAAKAQNLLTIAISTRQIQEGLLSARLLANIVAQNAYNASVAAGNAVTKAFYATIAANPFGAILALIGVLVTATIALSEAMKTSTTAQEDFNTAVDESLPKVKAEIAQIETLNSIIQDNTRSNQERGAALEQLKGKVEGLKDVELDQADANERINKAVKAQLPLLIAKARVSAAAAIYEKAVTAQLEAQAEGLDKFNFSLKTLIGGLFGPAGRLTAVIQQAQEEGQKLNKQSTDALNLLQNETEAYTKLLGDQNEVEEENTKVKKKNARATKEQELAYKALQKELKGLQDILKAEIEVYENLGKVADAEESIPVLVEKTNKLLQDRLKIIDKANQGIIKSFEDLGFVVNKETGKFVDASQTFDQFGLSIEIFRKEIANLVAKQDFKALAQQVALVRQEAVKAFGEGLIDRSQLNSIIELTDNYENFAKIIGRFPELQEVLGADFLPQYLTNLGKLGRISGDIAFDFDQSTGKIVKANTKLIDINVERRKQIRLEETAIKNLTARYLEQAEGNVDSFLQRAELSFEQKKIIEDQVKSLRSAGEDEKKIAQDVAQSVAKARLDALTANVKAVVEEENKIRGFFFTIQQNNIENAKISRDTAAAILTSNLSETRKFVGGQIEISKSLRTQFFQDLQDGALTTQQIAEKYGTQFTQLQEQLNKKGLEGFELTEEEKLKILQFYLEQQQKEEDKANARRIRGLQQIVSSFKTLVQALNEFQSIASQQYELQLERLRLANEYQLGLIVGDTKEANDKRLQLQAEYEAQEKQIQKEARITSLRFSLIQAVANTAEAITKAFTAGPIIGQIAAGIAAAASAVQIGIITQQLNLAQSLKRGGMIRAQEGMVVRGPSHENGGVMFNNGGFNLEGGEMIINRTSAKKYSGLLSQVNMAGGGAPMVISNFDDSRIVDAIAKSKQDSIRAFVVERDITDKQAQQKRLSQLAQF